MSRSAVSLRLSLSGTIALMVVLTSLALGSVVYLTVRDQNRVDLEQRLGSLVQTLALAIDGEAHKSIKELADAQVPTYLKFRDILWEFQAANPDIGFVYSLRAQANGSIQFVLDSGKTEDEYSPPGMVYDDPSPLIVEAMFGEGSLQVAKEFYTDEWGTWLSAYYPIHDGQGRVDGVLAMDISANLILTREANLLTLIGLISLVVALVAIAAGWFISRRISRPLLLLAEDMGRIQSLQLDTLVHTRSHIAEVSIMTSALENMKKGLRSFRKYVPADVVGQLISLNKEAILETEKRSLSIFFSDLENFTTASEAMNSEALAEVLGGYFDTMTRQLQSHFGTVDKFIGDSVMAFWGAPVAQQDHAINACKAALGCMKALKPLEQAWQEAGIPSMRTRIGINTGDCIVGNVGYESRLSFTAMGDPVNVASRLESLNKLYKTGILIGERTWDSVRDHGFTARLVDKVAVKGKQMGARLYELVCEGEPDATTAELLDLYHHALDWYFHGKFAEAHKGFSHIVQGFPNDGPSQVMLHKCERFMATPPPLPWDGVTHLDEK